jgi:post-segregation antitoxin (ccd killing protein)
MATPPALDDPTVVGSPDMKTTKISVTLDADLVQQARAFARGNLSRYLNEALRDKLRNENLRKLLEDAEAEYGPVPEELLAEAEATFKAAFEAAEEGWREWQRQHRG